MSEQRTDAAAESAAGDAMADGARRLRKSTALAQEQERAEEPSASASPGGANADGSNPTGEDIAARSAR